MASNIHTLFDQPAGLPMNRSRGGRTLGESVRTQHKPTRGEEAETASGTSSGEKAEAASEASSGEKAETLHDNRRYSNNNVDGSQNNNNGDGNQTNVANTPILPFIMILLLFIGVYIYSRPSQPLLFT